MLENHFSEYFSSQTSEYRFEELFQKENRPVDKSMNSFTLSYTRWQFKGQNLINKLKEKSDLIPKYLFNTKVFKVKRLLLLVKHGLGKGSASGTSEKKTGSSFGGVSCRSFAAMSK